MCHTCLSTKIPASDPGIFFTKLKATGWKSWGTETEDVVWLNQNLYFMNRLFAD